jgi:hypothetical protein
MSNIIQKSNIGNSAKSKYKANNTTYQQAAYG